MDNIDFAALPDTEAVRLMAEMDGYYVEGPERKRWVLKDKNGHVKPSQGSYRYTADSEAQAWSYAPRYPGSLDAAVGWLGRMGLEWVRVNDTDGRFFVLVWRESNFQCYGQTVYESPTCPTARALCNAGWSAVQAREAGEA